MGKRKHIKLIEREVGGELREMKECTSCGEVKFLEEFNRSKKGFAGRASKCRKCVSTYRKRHNKTSEERNFIFEKDGEKFKKCNKCRVVLPVKKFYRHGKGVTSKCRKCLSDERRKGTAPKIIEVVLVNGVESKECRSCGEVKPLDSFQKSGNKGIGNRRGDCRECMKVISARYRKEHREKMAERSRRWRERNPIKQKEASRRWRESNKHKDVLYRNKRNSAKKGLRNDLTPDEWEDILSRFKGKCSLTGDKQDISMDHFIPISTGYGGTYVGNVYPLSLKLNTSKWNRNPFEWYEKYGRNHGVSKDRWNELISYLSSENDMTPEEFERYVNDIFEKVGEAVEK